MRIFALLTTEDVRKVYETCDQYLDRFDSGEEYGSLVTPSNLIPL